jgi:dual specificity tyrosine-phosphorylation-regulated kinase 1
MQSLLVRKSNAVKCLETFTHQNHVCIVFEICAMNLFEILRSVQFSGLALVLVRKFAFQILQSLRFLSRPDVDIIHCDLKPEK